MAWEERRDGWKKSEHDARSNADIDFLLKTYERLFSPRMGSVFDSL
jgi:hypothetical protein